MLVFGMDERHSPADPQPMFGDSSRYQRVEQELVAWINTLTSSASSLEQHVDHSVPFRLDHEKGDVHGGDRRRFRRVLAQGAVPGVRPVSQGRRTVSARVSRCRFFPLRSGK